MGGFHRFDLLDECHGIRGAGRTAVPPSPGTDRWQTMTRGDLVEVPPVDRRVEDQVGPSDNPRLRGGRRRQPKPPRLVGDEIVAPIGQLTPGWRGAWGVEREAWNTSSVVFDFGSKPAGMLIARPRPTLHATRSTRHVGQPVHSVRPWLKAESRGGGSWMTASQVYFSAVARPAARRRFASSR